MLKKEKYLLVTTFLSIIIVNAQEVPIANSFRFPLEGDWSPLWQDFGKWNNQWNGYHLGEDIGREDADIKNYAVYPMADGVIKFADIVLGYTVIIEHKLPVSDPGGDYVCSVYYHMKRPGEGGIKLTLGEAISTDSPIGYVSGKRKDYKSLPHLHFGIRKGPYKSGKDPRTGFWYYPGYTTIKKDGEVQKNPDDPTHKQILADWFDPTTLPGFIERHIIQKKQTLLSPSKIIESFIEAINKGDLVSAKESEEFPHGEEYSLVCGEHAAYIGGTITWRLTKWGKEWMVSDCNNLLVGEFKRTWK
jgi:murein DD-endopeptidase MepM/ murein hydrolase activator NlpD